MDRLKMKVKMNKKFSYLIIVITAILVISMPVQNGTLVANDGPQTEAPTLSSSHKKAALMIGGDETDLGFSWVAIQGMYHLRDKFNWSISISRQVAFPDQYDVANNYGAAGYDVVFMVGGQFIETSYFSGLPDKWNETVWVQIPGLNFSHKENLVGLHPNFQTEGHYLAGVLAGLMTETDNIGVVFGEWYEYLSMEFYAFKAGVESVNSVACVHGRVAGTWGDAALGKQITKALIETKNVDIVVQVADTTGRGVIAAVIEAGIAVIGTVGDQYSLAPLNTMTSIGMNTSIVMDYVVSNIENLTPWNLYYASLNMTEVGGFLFPYHHYDSIIPQSVKDQVDNAKAGIANGTIKVPEIWNDDAGPEAPTDCPTPPAPEIPGFPFLGIAFATMLGVVVLLVTKKRIIPNKHKS
jgi:basic membrane protein A